MKYELLIFDWDGTLIDSAARIVSSFQNAARELGYRIPTDDAVRDIIGLGLPEAIAKVMPELDKDGIDRMRGGYSQQFLHEDQTPVNLFDQVEAGLEQLAQSGYRLAVATGKSRRGLDRVLADTGLGAFFEHTRCADETCSKPDPQMLHELLTVTGVPASRSLMIGDTEYDLEMAHRAGVPSVAVHYGVHSPERLKVWKPQLEIGHFSDLVNWLVD